MRWLFLAYGLVIIVPAAIAATLMYHPHFSMCSEQEDIPAANRESMERAATAFVRAGMRSDIDAAWDSLSTRGRASAPKEQLGRAIRQLTAPAEMSAPEPVRAFYVRTFGFPIAGAKTPCRTALVGVGETGQTGHVLLRNEFGPLERTTDVWLEFENRRWRTRGFWTTLTRYGPYGAADLWRMAREQHAKGHAFNAALLFATVDRAMGRGPLMQSYETAGLASEAREAPPPPEFRGESPFRITRGSKTFVITVIDYAATERGLVLRLIQRLPEWRGDVAADAANRELFAAFDATYSEWREVAGEVLIGSETPTPGHAFLTSFAPLSDRTTETALPASVPRTPATPTVP